MSEKQAAGERELLSTKLVPPQAAGRVQKRSLIARPRLLSRLDEGLDKRVTLISAPAGFGKTTVAGEWLGRRRAQDDLPPLAWVSLDEGDNDPVRFWRYVLNACRTFNGGAARGSLALLNNAPQPPFEALLTMVINEIARLPQQVILALEDYHLITSPQIQETMAFFVDNAPSTLHLMLITRSDPPLPLARLRAYNELNELRAADLRFTEDEVHDFLSVALPVSPSGEVSRQLAQRTEGWAAGLRLVALAVQGMREREEIERYVAGFSGSHRPIVDYLLGDVFSAQSPDVQEFLLQTSFLDRLSAPLCDAVTGREDSARLLEQMERANLFLVPLQEEGHWYRYHALFAEAMQHHARRQLGEGQLRDLSQKAARWYEDNGMLAEATEAALFARDYTRAADLVQRIIAPRLVRNEFHTLRRWMEQLPQAVLEAHPEICMTLATAILFTSPRHLPETKQRLQTPLQIAEAHWRQEQDAHRLGEVFAFRSLLDWLQGDFRASFAHARRALDLLPDADRQWRGISLIMLGAEGMLTGHLHEARRASEEALALCEAAQNIYGTLDSLLLLGEISYQEGRLNRARQRFEEVLARSENAPMNRDQAAIRGARAQLGLGRLHLERNELEAAQAAIAEAAEAAERFPQEYTLTDAPLALADVLIARGEIEQAQALVDRLPAQAAPSFLFRHPDPYRARLALARGDVATAGRRAQEDRLPEDGAWPIHRQQAALVRARLALTHSEAERAIAQLEPLLHEIRRQGQRRTEIEAGALMAKAYAAAGRRSDARETLIQALKSGQTANHRRIFLDEGPQLARLLQEMIAHISEEALAGYARALFYDYSQEQARLAEEKTTPADGGEWLVDPLTEQELRVLRLLAAGLSNPQIGEELVISVNTVKTHVKNIYGKLNVSNRRQAREAARQLDLI